MPTCHASTFFFFFNDTATTEIYTLSLHDALPIWERWSATTVIPSTAPRTSARPSCCAASRSEEHTSELQSHSDLVCRLLLEKKKKQHCLTLRASLTPPLQSSKRLLKCYYAIEHLF